MAAVGLELIFTVKVQLPLVHNIFRLLAPHSLVCEPLHFSCHVAAAAARHYPKTPVRAFSAETIRSRLGTGATGTLEWSASPAETAFHRQRSVRAQRFIVLDGSSPSSSLRAGSGPMWITKTRVSAERAVGEGLLRE